MQQQKQAIGYVRVSTTEQAIEGVSLAAQRAKIAAWCAANGYELVTTHQDKESGRRTDNRPGVQRALAEVTQHKGAALVVYSLSRLARSTQDALAMSKRLDKAGADLVSLSEKIDTTSAAGKMVFRMLAVLAEFERDIISERTTVAMQHKKAKGERISREPAYGWRFTADNRVVRDAREQRIVSRVLVLRACGQSLRQIAATLAAAGLRPRTGRHWHAKTIKRIVDAHPAPCGGVVAA